jgi:ribosome biogenesis GTPase
LHASVLSGRERLGWNDHFDGHFEPYRAAGLAPARVAAQHRGAYVLLADEGELDGELAGRLRHAALAATDMPAVGDWVAVRPLSGERRAIVHAVLARRTAFVRLRPGQETEAQVLAANVDVAFLVAALDTLNVRRLERYLTLAWESGAEPVVVLTKADLRADAAVVALEVETVALGVPVHVVSNVTGEGLDAVRAHLAGDRTGALLGASGAGKSTLVNSLYGREVLRVAGVRDDGKGRHTTTHRELVALPGGGLLLDTPGMRELALWDASSGLEAGFADVEALTAQCRFSDCAHNGEPGCAIAAALASGALAPERWASFRKLERELAALARRQDKRLASDARKQWRRMQRARRRGGF